MPRPTLTICPVLLVLSSTVASLCAQTLPTPTGSAATTAKSGPTVLEAFTVTGSNIRRIDEETTLPVTAVDLAEITARNTPTAADFFETITSNGAMTLNETNVLGADARGDNVAINLRGVGSGNTLVLINGRRLAPHPISQSEGGPPSLSVNANQLPISAASRVEILRDGSSAIYGSDAAAGVVNTLLRTDYDGASLSFAFNLPEQEGGGDRRFTLTWGDRFNARRTSLTLMIDAFHRDLLRGSHRAWARNADSRSRAPAPWDGVQVRLADGTLAARDNDFDNRSASSIYGNYWRGTFDAAGTFTGGRPAGNAGISTSTTLSAAINPTTAGIFYVTPMAGGAVGFRPTSPSRNVDSVESAYYYNLNESVILQPETNRFNVMGQFDHAFSERLALRGELFYYDARSETRRERPAVDGQDEFNIHVGADNPFNPFGSRFYHPTGAPNSDGTRRLVGQPAPLVIAPSTGARPRDFRERIARIHSQAWRGVLEARGKIWNDFEWRSGLAYGGANTRDVENFVPRESRMRRALVASSPAEAFNPFGYTFRINADSQIVVDQPYTNPDAVVNRIYDDFIREGFTELAIADAKVDGTLFTWRNVPFSTAFGAEYRYENYRDWRAPYSGLNPANDPDPFLPPPTDNDFIGLSPNINLYSERYVISGFAEVFAPLVNRRNRTTFVHSVDLSAAVRSEHFSTVGNATKPKVAMSYRPVRSLMLRGSYNRSFRAPNLVQTNTQPLQRNGASADPYRSEVTNLAVDGSANRTNLRIGNEKLTPEESDTWNLGVAVEVPWVRGLSLTFDYFELKQRNVIAVFTATDVLEQDEILLDRATQAQLAAGKSIADVDLGSGTSTYLGSPQVRRNPVTEADRAFFNAFNARQPSAQQRGVVGRASIITENYVNLAGRDVRGWEASVQQRFPRTRLGTFTCRGDATYSLRFRTQETPTAIWESTREENGRPKWRATASLAWREGGWSATWFANYSGEFVDTSAATTAAIWEALGYPSYIRRYNNDGLDRYYFRVKPSISHTANLGYAFGRREGIWRNVAIRVGVSNVFDVEPPFLDNTVAGYTGVVAPRGRTYSLQLSKRL